MIDMRAERCKTCIHTPVCGRDMNTTGTMYVSPNPMFFTKEYCDEALRKYQEREAAGFPCKFYKCMCKDCKHRKGEFHVDRRRKEGGYWVYWWCDLDTGDPYELGRNAEDDNWFCADSERREDGTDAG